MKSFTNAVCVAILLLVGWAHLSAGGLLTGGAPFPADKLSVLVVEETEDRTRLPAAQVAILTGVLPEAVKGKGGELRVLDKDATLDHAPQWVKDAMAVERGELPWLLVSNGRSGFSGPLPATADEARSLMEGY